MPFDIDALLHHLSMWTMFETIWTCLTVQSCSNLKKDRSGFEGISWGYTILHDMRLGKIIKHVICGMLEFSWNFWGIFLCKYFKSLKYPERVFEGFDQYFEHDHVLKLLYMDNICPLRSPRFFPNIFKALK